MVPSSVATEFQLFFTLLIHTSAAGTHSLKYFNTGVRKMNLTEFTAVGMVDGGQFSYYDSNIKKAIPKTEWIKKFDSNYWNRETDRCQVDEENFKANVTTVMKRFNHTEGVHVLQRMYGCKLDDDGTIRGYDQFGYDGEDFISLDLNTLTWTTANDKAVMTKHKWDLDVVYNNKWKNYLEKECIFWLKKFVSYGRETLEMKDRPEASVFLKNFPRPELVCHATGFFPSDLMMSWQKDGEELHEDVEIRETLPNQDGTFQRKAVLRVSPEDLQKHEYTCVVQHSSLEKDLVLKAPDVGGPPLGIIVGAVVAVLALIAGVVIWKKKNSGFKPVPAKPNSSSEKDSENSSSTSTMPSTSANDAPEKDSEHRSSSSNDSDASSMKNKSLTCRDRGADGGGEMKSCTDDERGVGDKVSYFSKPHQTALRRYFPKQLCYERPMELDVF